MKAFQNQTAALRMPLSAFGAVRRPLFWMGCAFLLTVWLLLALPGWAVLPCAAGGVLCIGWLSRGSLRHFLPLLALFSLLGLAVVLCHRWLAQARLLPLLLAAHGLTPLCQQEVPPGDGGISLGQAAWAQACLRARMASEV